MSTKRVVIVGCGFGGLACARSLNGEAVEVTLVDKHNYHLFTPLLYQVATALLNPSDIGYPIRKIFRNSPNVRFLQAEVSAVDLEGRRLVIATGEELAFDEVVLATGSTTNYFGNESVAQRALGLKDLDEALQLRNHILSCLERASAAAIEGDDDTLASWLTFVIVGAGPTGVEFAGALGELFHLVLPAEYPAIARQSARIVLVEGSDRILGSFHPVLGSYAAATLADRGVEVVLGTLVTDSGDDFVSLSDGSRLPTRTVVWSAGVRPADPGIPPGATRSRAGRVEVDEQLRVQGHAHAYAIGDLASVADGDSELPMLGPPAMQAGRYVAEQILASVEPAGRVGGRTRPFRYLDKGTMATIGRSAAVAQIGSRIHLTGFLGWIAWLFLHLYYLIGFHARARVLAAWAVNYIRGDRPIRIIARAKDDPLRPTP